MIEKLHTCGLLKASPDDLNIQRLKHGRGFRYVQNGKTLTDAKKKKYLKSLAIPPVYSDVHLTTNKRYHLQATGLDTNNNRQYFYHPKWENYRDTVKFARLPTIGKQLPKIRRKVNRDLKQPEDSLEFMLAGIVKLLDYTGLRIGNWNSAKNHKTYGLITLHHKHFDGEKLHFHGKAGVEIERPIFENPVQQLLETFYDQYENMDEPMFEHNGSAITPTLVNNYLDDISGINMTAKEFRTWRSCALFVKYWRQAVQRKEDLTLKHTIEQVAQHTCNTVSILKSSYLHPMLLEQFKEEPAQVLQKAGKTRGLRQDEALLLKLIK